MADAEPAAEVTRRATPDAKVAAPPDQPKSNTLLLLVIGLLVIVLTPLATFIVVKKTVQPAFAAPTGKEALTQTQTHSLGTLFINVAGTKGTRILKVEPVLLISEGRLNDELNRLQPRLRDRVQTIVSTRTIDDLEKPSAREMMKKEIMDSINEMVRDKMAGTILEICFNEFLIQ